jgi:hypothetical protein
VTILRRFLVLGVLFFWQGGLTFYGAVVIPIGARVLGSHRSQAVITREVVQVATVAGLLALVLFCWDVLATRDPAGWRRHVRQCAAMGIAFTWVVLSCLQFLLNQRFDPDSLDVGDLASFRELHRLYLWITTAQWVFCLLFLLAGLGAWRAEDRAMGESAPIAEDETLGTPQLVVDTEEDCTFREVEEGRGETTGLEGWKEKFQG